MCLNYAEEKIFTPPKEYRVRTLFPYEGQRPEDLGRLYPLSLKVMFTQ